VRPDAIIIADHALARRRAALRSLADFATATDRRLNGPRQVCCRINRAVFDSAEPARNAGPRLVCALCRADRAGGRDMTFSENGVRPRCGWQQNKNRQRGGVPNGGFIVALLANTVTGDAARRKRVAFHAAVCDSDRARQPLFPRSGAAARPYGTLGNTSHCRWDRPPRRAAVRNRRSADIKAGKFSASCNPDGSLAIDPAELFRAFSPVSHNTTSNVPRDDSQPVGNGASTVEHMAPTADLMLLRERVAKAEGERDLLLDQVAALRGPGSTARPRSGASSSRS